MRGKDNDMRVGIIGTGAIAWKHAEAYKNIGYKVAACTDIDAAIGRQFAEKAEAEFVPTVEDLCQHPQVDYVDVCTPPNFRLQPLKLCIEMKKPILVQKPIATECATARTMVTLARNAGILLGVVSQRRFEDSVQFLKHALADGRLGKIIEADAYVKWYRSPAYYGRPGKGTWAVEGGGALINQAIHGADLLLYLVGSVRQVFGYWQLGATHEIESEDCLNAVLRFNSGATGLLQAATALWPGYPERLEIHGSKGTAIITGDKLTTWDVQNDMGEDVPIISKAASGASDPMGISILPIERQLLDFGRACQTGQQPLVSGVEGFRALQLTTSIYNSCRQGKPVEIASEI